MTDAITKTEYVTLQSAFDFFNRELFAGKLPQVLITFQRHANSRGYFCSNRFMARDGNVKVHEIALNPDNFHDRTDKQIFSTLVHEMVHQSQEEAGTAPKSAYHNKAWADEMETVGLMPSDTGKEGGKRTGQRVTHYIIEGGAFDKACDKLLAKGARLSWQSSHGNAADKKKAKQKKASKTKFTCHGCDANAWGKPDLNITCTECEMKMVAEG